MPASCASSSSEWAEGYSRYLEDQGRQPNATYMHDENVADFSLASPHVQLYRELPPMPDRSAPLEIEYDGNIDEHWTARPAPGSRSPAAFGATSSDISMTASDRIPGTNEALAVIPSDGAYIPTPSRDLDLAPSSDFSNTVNTQRPPYLEKPRLLCGECQNSLLRKIKTITTNAGYEPDPDAIAVNLAEKVEDFYSSTGHWKAEGQLDARPTINDLEMLISDTAEEFPDPRVLCRSLLKRIDALFSSRGWHCQRTENNATIDSGIGLDLSASTRASNETRSTNASFWPSEWQGKRPGGVEPAHIPPGRKRARTNIDELPHSPALSDSLQPTSRPKTNPKMCHEPNCNRGHDFATWASYRRHVSEVHFPERVTMCVFPIGGKEVLCTEMKTRKGNFGSHLEQAHGLGIGGGRDTKQEDYLKDFEIRDIYHEICPYCIDVKRLNSWKELLFHLQQHYEGNVETFQYEHRCDQESHDWKKSRKLQDQKNRTRNLSAACRDRDSSYQDRTADDDDDDDQSDRHRPNNFHKYDMGHIRPRGEFFVSQSSTEQSLYQSPYQSGSTGRQCQSAVRVTELQSKSEKSSSKPKLGIAEWSTVVPAAPMVTDSKPTDFIFIRHIGRGAFGTVDEVLSIFTKERYARKCIAREGKVKSFCTELEILKTLRHHHIIRLVNSIKTQHQLCLFTQPVAQGDLATYLQNDTVGFNTRFSDQRTRKWPSCLLSALDYLHTEEVIHGDIKPQNVLISGDLSIYLSDFGNAKAKHLQNDRDVEALSISELTPKYCAPEVSHNRTFKDWSSGKAADVFSLGCVFTEMETVFTGQSIQTFDTFRSGGSAFNSFKTHLPRTYLWIDHLCIVKKELPQTSIQSDCTSLITLEVTRKMIRWEPDQRPSTRALRVAVAVSQKESRGNHSGSLCHSLVVKHGVDNLRVKTYFGQSGATIYKIKFKWPIHLPQDSPKMWQTFLLKPRMSNGNDTQSFTPPKLREPRRSPIPKLLGLHRSSPSEPVSGIHCLEDYFQDTSPPSSLSDVCNFWHSVSALLTALESIHDEKKFYGYHIDLRPENILILRSETRTCYDWSAGFKLADFGISYVKRDERVSIPKVDSVGEEVQTLDNSKPSDLPTGTRVFQRLEPNNAEMEDGKSFSIDRAMDIWSLGRVLSETVRWVVYGYQELVDFRRKHPMQPCFPGDRAPEDTEVSSMPGIQESLPDSCDPVTRSIAERVIVPMLDPQDSGLSLRKLRNRAAEILSEGWRTYKNTLSKASQPVCAVPPPKERHRGAFSIWTEDGAYTSPTSTDDSTLTLRNDGITPHPPDSQPSQGPTTDSRDAVLRPPHENVTTKPSGIQSSLETNIDWQLYSVQRFLQDRSDSYKISFFLERTLPENPLNEIQELHGLLLDTVVKLADKKVMK